MTVPVKKLNTACLPDLEQPPEMPFILDCQAGELICQQSLRFLPSKRLVVKALLNDREVIAKCFFGSHAKRDMQREVTGIKGFQKSGINTPQLIGHHGNEHFAVVITACLAPTASFEDIWNSDIEDSERQRWLTHIAGMMAAMHNAGVQQIDIHLDNLLLNDGQLYLIDGGGAKVRDKCLTKQEALENLAMFQAVLYPRFDCYLNDIWQAYAIRAPEIAQQSSLAEFSDLVQQQRKWREKYIFKGLRNCTRFHVEKSWHRFISVDRDLNSGALQKFIGSPEHFIAQSHIIKSGSTNTVAIVTLGNGEKVLVKRYKSQKGIVHKYLRCLTKSRARISWLNSLLLEMIGIATPEPMAMVEERWGPAVLCSYIVTRFVPGQQAINWFPENVSTPEAPGFACKVADILKTLERSLVLHSDMKATNILLVNNRPMLIDLDGMRSYRTPAKFRQVSEIDRKRFNKNWEGHPEVQQLFEPYIRKKLP